MKNNKRKLMSIILSMTMVMTMGLGGSVAGANAQNTTAVATATSGAIKTATKSAITATSGAIKTTTSPAITATSGAIKTVTPAAVATNGAFRDTAGHWADQNIKEAASLGIVGGYVDGTFLPDNLIKREEFFKLLTNVLTVKPDTSKTVIKFTDVVDNEWYVPTIKMAVAANITKGYEDGTFGIGKMMTRQEAAKVVASVIPTEDITESTSSVQTVKDKSNIDSWAYDYVDIMFKKGYMKGDDEGNFRPAKAMTRAEAATILLHIKKKEAIIAANANELVIGGCMKTHKVENGAFKKGEGTKSEPYEIATEAQLNHMRLHTSEGAFYLLTKDIKITSDFAITVPKSGSDETNWSGGNFEPIGTKANPFKGHLKGDRHTISGVTITGGTVGIVGKESGVGFYTGLFGWVGENASVESLTIDSSTMTGGEYTGGIAAYNLGAIKNCILAKDVTVTGNNYTGGVVGYSESALVSNINKGVVVGKSSNTGGIVGSAKATLESCANLGKVTGNEKTGGVAGTVMFEKERTLSVISCSNSGEIKGGAYQAGGVVGLVDASAGTITVEKCYNKGLVSGNGLNGGIVGQAKNGKALITQCYNEGTVTGDSGGGIIGSNEGTLQYSYNLGAVAGNVDAGGIAALQVSEESKITKCYNTGSVTANSFAGGIVGTNGTRVNNCYNAGSIKGTNSIGGIAGKNEGTIENVYGAGTVTASNGAGSLVGRHVGTLKNAYWLQDSCSSNIGMLEQGAIQQIVKKVTKEELSGQKKLKTANGYEMMTDVLNAGNVTTSNKNPAVVWQYQYKTTSQASSGTTNILSDGGGVVKPLEEYLTDETGNTIAPSDLESGYLYPMLLNM